MSFYYINFTYMLLQYLYLALMHHLFCKDILESFNVLWHFQYYFEDRFNLVKFSKIVRDAGLYMILRIGPFVAAEWNFGQVLNNTSLHTLYFTSIISFGYLSNFYLSNAEECRYGYIMCPVPHSEVMMSPSRFHAIK